MKKKIIVTLALTLMLTLLAFPTNANAAKNKVTPTSKSLYCDQSVTLKVKGAVNNKIKVSGKWYPIKWRYSGNTDLKIKNGKCSFDYGEVIEKDKLKVTAYYVKSGKKVTLGTCTITMKAHNPKYTHKHKIGKYDYMACGRCNTCYKELGKHTHDLTTVKTVTEVNKWERCGVHKKCTVDNCNYYTVENAKDYKFNEQEVYDEMVQIYDYYWKWIEEIEDELCQNAGLVEPDTGEYYDDPAWDAYWDYMEDRAELLDEWVKKYSTIMFKEWLVEKGYYPASILKNSWYLDSKSTAYWSANNRVCSGGPYIFTGCLQGYQRYKCLANETNNPENTFDYTTLKPGDALVGSDHVEMFLCWRCYDGDEWFDIPVTEDVKKYIDFYGKENIEAKTIRHSTGNYGLFYDECSFNDLQGYYDTDFVYDDGPVWSISTITGEVWRLANY